MRQRCKDSWVPEQIRLCHFESACWVQFTVAFQRKKTEAIGIKAALPGFVDPALAFSIDKVPSGSRWIHEIKFDGYRVQVHLANEAVRIFTRRGHDCTHCFKKVSLFETDRAQGRLGRAKASCRDRVPGEVRRGQGPASIFQRIAGGPMMDAYDRFGSGPRNR
jgi:ATP dependent DNA ligase domain